MKINDCKNKLLTLYYQHVLPTYRERVLPIYHQHKLLILSLTAIMVFAVGYKLYRAYQLTASAHQTVVNVTVADVSEKTLSVPFKAVGAVTAYKSVDIKSQVDGQIMQIPFSSGQMVRKDQLLFIIDPRPAENQLKQLTANLAKDRAQLKNAQLNTTRDKALIKKSFVSQAAYDQDLTNEAIQQANVQADEAAVENAKLQLDYSYIKAPIGGRTGDIFVDEGNVLKSAQYGTLTTINQLQPIYVNFSLPQQYLSVVAGAHAKPIPVKAALQKQVKTGQISFVDNQINTSTGTFNLKATFPNTDLILWPGQYVEVTLPTAQFNQALTVPSATVQQGPNGSYVFVIQTNNSVAYRLVTIGPTVADDTIVLQGLKKGERVVTSGQLQLVDGTAVHIVPPAITTGKKP